GGRGRSCPKNVRQRRGDSVSGIGGLRRALQPQQMRHHGADLVLPRTARADDGLFDHGWSVVGDRELRLCRRQQDDPSCMAEDERRTDVLMIEGILEREYRWLVPLDELCNL